MAAGVVERGAPLAFARANDLCFAVTTRLSLQASAALFSLEVGIASG
jgi:hypothetical protein